MSITAHKASSAMYYLGEARDAALLFAIHGGKFSQQQIVEHLSTAATILGFTLTPITEALPTETPATRDPDSGRPSLVEPAAPIHFENDWK